MRRVDGTSRNIDRPAGVSDRFQISADSVEPTIASLSANLFAHDDPRPTLADESKKVRPQVPRIVNPGAFARDAERLARTGAGPDFEIVGPSGEFAGGLPEPGAGEEVGSLVSEQIVGVDVLD